MIRIFIYLALTLFSLSPLSLPAAIKLKQNGLNSLTSIDGVRITVSMGSQVIAPGASLISNGTLTAAPMNYSNFIIDNEQVLFQPPQFGIFLVNYVQCVFVTTMPEVTSLPIAKFVEPDGKETPLSPFVVKNLGGTTIQFLYPYVPTPPFFIQVVKGGRLVITNGTQPLDLFSGLVVFTGRQALSLTDFIWW